MNVSVIGACGHVGYPFSLVLAKAGHLVTGIDINDGLCEKLNAGCIPHVEDGAYETFHATKENLYFTTKTSSIKQADVIVIMIGAPVDAENNPRLDELMNFVKFELADSIKKGQLVVMRSTVSPGTTEIVRDLLEKESRLTEGKDFHLVFAPERVAQGKAIVESTKLPQIIGAFNLEGYKKARAFFETINDHVLFQLTPREAEVGKLVTNMYRYVNFALANEFYMIGESQGIDVHKVIEACNKDYPRMNLPTPGPNVGGPCLYKDGRFLLTGIPYADLINTSFLINEGMPDYIFGKIVEHQCQGRLFYKRILILGMTFKADSDDTRSSLSFKMRKVVIKNGCEAVCYDPFVDKYLAEPKNLSAFDAVVLMTPHTELKDWLTDNGSSLSSDTVIVDIWKHFPESIAHPTGIYRNNQ